MNGQKPEFFEKNLIFQDNLKVAQPSRLCFDFAAMEIENEL